MSIANLYHKLTQARDSAGSRLFAWAQGAPTDGAIGYAPGCLLVATGGAAVSNVLYVNLGDGSACEFAPVCEVSAEQVARLSLDAVDGADGTASLIVQATDAAGNELADTFRIRVWVGTADDLGVDAITGITIAAGTQTAENTANGDYTLFTDATGGAVLTLDNGAAGTLYAWAELGGRVFAAGAIEITSD